jgi:hypothetical protein
MKIRIIILILSLTLPCGVMWSQLRHITGAEYFWDSDPGVGNGIPLNSSDGSFDEAIETALDSTTDLPSTGPHSFSVRYLDAAGTWGPAFKTIILIDVSTSTQRSITVTQGEYFWDTDPGVGSGIPFLAFDGNYDEAIETIAASTSDLPSVGAHLFGVRVRDAENAWSNAFSTIIEIDEIASELRQIKVNSAEYFWDTDPGVGSGIPFLAFDGNYDEAIETISASSSDLPALGAHLFGVRIRDAENTWSNAFSTVIEIDEIASELRQINVSAAEYFWDLDPGQGSGTPLLAFDGNFDQAIESAVFSSNSLPAIGNHVLNIRMLDAEGTWTAPFSILIEIDEPATALREIKITSAEAFWDVDPGAGSGIPMIAFDGNYDEAIEIAAFSDGTLPSIGAHKFTIRVRDAENQWSPLFSTVIEIDEPYTAQREIKITSGELFWDTDPGQGNGTPIIAFDGNYDEAIESAAYATGTLPSIGNHILSIRFRDAENAWSGTFSTLIEIDEPATAQRQIKVTMAEMFWDADPGQGNAIGMAAFDTNFDEAIEQAILCSGGFPGQGPHKLSVRYRDAENQWSPVFSTVILIDEPTTALRQIQLSAAEYFWGADPGQGNAIPMIVFDGNYNEAIETMTAFEAVSQTPGVKLLSVRIKSADGVWSSPFKTVVQINAPSSTVREVYVAAGEYWFDTDLGPGSGTPVVCMDGNFNEVIEGIIGGAIPSPVTTGIHTLYIRARDPEYGWGPKFGIVVNMDQTLTTFTTSISGPKDLCSGVEQLNQHYYAVAAAGSTYAWSIVGGFILSGQGTPHIVVNWNTGAVHTLTLQQCLSANCQTATYDINLYNATTTTQNITICEGDTYFAGGAFRSEAGVYVDYLQSQFGCDSTVTTILSITEQIVRYTATEICQGQFITLGGAPQTTSGTYLDVYTSAAGCDSLVYTILTVRPTYYNNVVVEICNGQSYFAGGANQTTSGFYTDLFQTIHGCDSLVVTQLVVGNSFHTYYNIDICQGETYFAGGANQSTSGTYVDFIGTTCTEIRTTYLTVRPTYAITQDIELFNGEIYFAGGAWQTEGGTYIDSLQTAFGCDSVITTNISIIPVHNDIQYITICGGESYYAGGGEQTTSGIYVDIITGICTATLTTYLTVNPSYNDTNYVQICTGQTYFAGGAEQNTSGIYIDALTTTLGCDSTITTVLSVINSIDVNQTVHICDGDSLFVGGAWQTESGTYIDETTNGICTEKITTLLIVHPNVINTISVSICEGLTWFAGGAPQSSSGSYIDVYQTTYGCDSTVTTILTVIPPSITPVEAYICEGDQILLGGSYQTEEGVYLDTLTNPASGCDSIIQTTLTFYPNYETNDLVFICQGDSVFVGGAWQTEDLIYTDVLQSVQGCDSIVNTLVQFYPNYHTFVSASVCAGDSLFVGGNWQTTGGDYDDLLVSINGCDSLVTTTLSIITNIDIPEVIDNGDASASCSLPADSYVWTIDGLGCDMIVVETTQQDIFLAPYCVGSEAFVVSVATIIGGCQSAFSEQTTIIIASCSQANDHCAGAVLLQVDGPVLIDSNQCATNSGEQEASCTDDIGRSVWYRFTTNNTHDLTIRVANVVPITSAFNPKMEIFTGNCSSLNEIACQNVGGNNQNEEYYLENPTAGQTYYVRVSGVLVQSGSYQISVVDESVCPGDFDNNGVINVTDLLIFNTNLGCTSNCIVDMDGNGVVNVVDLLIFASVYGTVCP